MRYGFSLVELSIVLVILGLLTGGILAGQSLIRASELRAVTTEFQRYHTSTNSFRDKYFQLPGDFTKATDFWVAAAVPATCFATAGTGTQTCNGNGNGNIDWLLAGGEGYTFWEHLANAGLIEGSYTGAADSGAERAGVNIPRSRVGSAGYVVGHADSATPTYSYVGNYFVFAGPIASGAYEGGVIKAEEAWNLDTKMDDGIADRGKVLAGPGNGSTGCTTGTAWTVGAAYDLPNTSASCRVVNGF